MKNTPKTYTKLMPLALLAFFAPSLNFAEDIDASDSSYTATIDNLILDAEGENYIYYTWQKGSAGYILEAVESGEPYDFYVQYDAEDDTNYIGKSATSTTESVAGGAIYNYDGAKGDITASFISNYATSTGGSAYGGAIYNYLGIIGTITGDFIGNYATSSASTGDARAGAIYNSSTISALYGDFVDNSANSLYISYGGAIFNYGTITDIVGDFTGNSTTAAYYSNGGAIYNYATIGSIVGDFIANYSYNTATGTYNYYSLGGAIFNVGTIDSIVGDFIDNYVYSLDTAALGGAIYNNTGATTSIVGDFIGNHATSNADYYSYTSGMGGAIYNNINGTIYYIAGDFIANYAENISTTKPYAATVGGAIYNAGLIENIIGDFIGNYATSMANTYGGAIYNYSSAYDYGTGVNIDSIVGDFIGNYVVSSSGNAYGGVIYNYAGSDNATIGSIEGNFIGNYASGTTGSAGGAIYLTTKTTYLSEITLTSSEGTSYVNIGNFATTKDLTWDDETGELETVLTTDDDANGGFLYMNGSVVANFATAANSSITIGDDAGTVGYDSIAGYGTINKTGEGDLIVNSSMEYYLGALNVQAGSFSLTNYDLGTSSASASSLSVSSGASFIMGDSNTAYVTTATIAGSVTGNITATSLSVSGTITGDVSVSDTVSLYVSSGNAGSTIIDGTLSGTYSTATVYLNDIGAALSSIGIVLATGDGSSAFLALESSLDSDFGLSYDDTDYTYTLNVKSDSNVTVDSDTGDITYTLDTNTTVTATVDSATNTTTEVVLSTSGDYTLSDTLTVDKVETTDGSSVTVSNGGNLSTSSTTDSTIIVGTDGTMTTGSITSDSSVTVSGGDLYYDNTLADDTDTAATNLVLQNLDSTLDESHADDLDAAIVTVEEGYVGVLHSDGSIYLIEEDSDTASAYHLDGETTLEAGTSGAIVISGDIVIDQSDNNSDKGANTTTLYITGDLVITEGSSIDSSGVDLTVSTDDATVSTNNSTITVGTDETALSVSGEGVTIAGSLSSTTGDDTTSSTAITVSNNSGEITFEDGAVISSDGTALTNYHEVGTDSNGLTAIANGSITFEGDLIANSPLYITAGTSTTSTAAVTVVGGKISTNYLSDADTITITGLDLILSTNNSGTLAYFANSGKITISAGNSIIIAATTSMLVGETYLLADATTVTANAVDDNYDFTTDVKSEYGDFDIEIADGTETDVEGNTLTTGAVYATATSLSYITDTMANTINEKLVATAIDNIEATSDSATNDAMRVFKSEVVENGLDSYLMNSSSYMSEVNTLLLNNMNFANVNRAREILNKSRTILIEDEDGSISFENEDGTISVVDASEVSLIKYSKVAQLQSINLLGSKTGDGNVAGYDYWSVGSTANIDAILSENAIVGISIGGAYSKVEGDLGDDANSTVFLLNAYGVVKSGIYPFELFANVGYAHFWNEGNKGSASAKWDSDAFNALAGIAFEIETGLENFKLNPLAMLNMVILNNDEACYSNGVNVDENSYISAKIMLGLEAEYAITNQFKASLKAMYAYEMGDEHFDMTYGFANGFASGIDYIGGETGKNSAIVGLGLSYDFSETCTGYFDYTAYIYERLITHSLNFSVALKF